MTDVVWCLNSFNTTSMVG